MSNKIVHSKVESKQILASISSLEQRVIALREQVSPENTLVTPLQRAKDCYRKRRLRGMMFESAYLFADPAWDILIDLFIASEEDQRISVSSACIGSAVPTTTALRYIKTLEEQGHIRRHQDPCDARRIFMSLTPTSAEKLKTYFSD